MARRTVTQVTDDIDNTELDNGHRPTTFSFDGKDYEIDLSEENRAKLHDRLEPYITAGRRASGKRPRRATTTAPQGSETNRKIREWARNNGYTPSNRGRISQTIVTAYEEAHPDE